jgi:hypothetical protein
VVMIGTQRRTVHFVSPSVLHGQDTALRPGLVLSHCGRAAAARGGEGGWRLLGAQKVVRKWGSADSTFKLGVVGGAMLAVFAASAGIGWTFCSRDVRRGGWQRASPCSVLYTGVDPIGKVGGEEADGGPFFCS